MARKDLGISITSETVAEATARFLAQGGQVNRVNGPDRSSDWVYSDYMKKMSEDRPVTADDMVVDTQAEAE